MEGTETCKQCLRGRHLKGNGDYEDTVQNATVAFFFFPEIEKHTKQQRRKIEEEKGFQAYTRGSKTAFGELEIIFSPRT